MSYPTDVINREIDGELVDVSDEERHAPITDDDLKSSPLNAGLAVIDVPDENWQAAAMARGLLRGYDKRWRQAHENIVLIECESTYHSPLVNLGTSRTSRTFTVAGKLDKLAKQTGTCLYDHKTTSSDISDPNSSYWRQLAVDSQPSHYELLLLANGIRIGRVVWDVIRKPGIKPKKLTKSGLAEATSLGTYCGFDATPETLKEISVTQAENAELYEHRVAAECIDNHERYFARRSVTRTRDELAEYAAELWDMATEMREARKHKRWYRNSGACMNYGTPCRYLGLCSGHDVPESDNWETADSVHAEIDTDGDGRDVITNSRLRVFQTCRRKHYYQYELGLRRVDEEEKSALYFGSLFHSALDQWWKRATPTKGT